MGCDGGGTPGGALALLVGPTMDGVRVETLVDPTMDGVWVQTRGTPGGARTHIGGLEGRCS